MGRTFIQGDLDGDDDVDAADFLLLQSSFGYRSDVLGEGIVAAPFDQQEWDEFVAAIPEPGAVGLVGVALAGLWRRRRRQRQG